MSQDKTIEGKKVIAKFMGLPECDRCKGVCDCFKVGVVYYNPDQLEYNTSFDWLMPVVDKIETIKSKKGHPIFMYLSAKLCTIEEMDIVNGKNKIIAQGKGPRIEAAYSAVVDFITWYNSQPKTPKK